MAEAKRKVAMTVCLRKDQLGKLKELRAWTKIPVAEYVREAIDLSLNAHTAEIPGQIPLSE